MMFDLNDTLSYKTYFKSIAQRNKLLGESNFIFGDDEIGQHEAADWQGAKLWVWPSERARFSPNDDNYFLKREGSLYVCQPRPEKYEEWETAYADCERIVKQIISKLINDLSESLISTQINSYTINRQSMTIGATHFIGAELVLNWDDAEGFEYNENDWI